MSEKSQKQIVQKQRLNRKLQEKILIPERKTNHNNANHLVLEITQERLQNFYSTS